MAKSIFPWRNKVVDDTVEINEKVELPAKKNYSFLSVQAYKNFVIKAVGNITTASYRRESFQRPEYNLEEIREASESDSYIKVALAKYSYLIYKAGWKLKGDNQEAIDYISRRFKIMGFCTGKPMDILFQEVADDLVRYSNAFLIKSRIDSIPGIKARPVLSEKIVGGYFRVDPASIKIKRDKHGNVLKYEQGKGENKKQFFPQDVIHIYCDRDANNTFGTPRIIAALDDVRLLRKIEGNVVALIHRFAMPLYQWKIGIPQVGFQGTDAEIRKAKREVESSSLDGLIITNEKTEIKSIGAEGNALNAQPYLTYFENRVFSALGVSASQMGRGATKSDADSLEAQTHDTVKYIQRVLSIFISELLISELLLEGGFDIFDDKNCVTHEFEEISLETKIKKENHEILKWQSNVTGHEETRRRIGLKDKMDDEEQLYERKISNTSSLEQIDRSGQWQEKLAKLNGEIAAKNAKAQDNSSNDSVLSNSGTKNNGTTSKRKRNTSGQKQPNKGVENNNRPTNQYGTTSVKVKESYNNMINYFKENNYDINSIHNEYFKNEMLTNIKTQMNYNCLNATTEALSDITLQYGSTYTLPKRITDLEEMYEELNLNINTLYEDIANSLSNNKIEDITSRYFEDIQNLSESYLNRAYLYSYINTGSLLGVKEIYIKPIEEEEFIALNPNSITINDIASNDLNECIITFCKK